MIVVAEFKTLPERGDLRFYRPQIAEKSLLRRIRVADTFLLVIEDVEGSTDSMRLSRQVGSRPVTSTQSPMAKRAQNDACIGHLMVHGWYGRTDVGGSTTVPSGELSMLRGDLEDAPGPPQQTEDGWPATRPSGALT